MASVEDDFSKNSRFSPQDIVDLAIKNLLPRDKAAELIFGYCYSRQEKDKKTSKSETFEVLKLYDNKVKLLTPEKMARIFSKGRFSMFQLRRFIYSQVVFSNREKTSLTNSAFKICGLRALKKRLMPLRKKYRSYKRFWLPRG